ncbi:hypothetical protein EVAR_60331_1 [Eumeta japonica]|uniref:Uncharacterized protein n=1 Tax=Eumeta variegata TaxID=151549 RepID=A0A4C1Z8I7_EUMVA|nr:hypothetical protein EVAR_60331_1 [Eumeta japonica]
MVWRVNRFSDFFIEFSTGKRAYGSLKSRRSSPPMNTYQPQRFTSVLLTSWVEIGYPIDREWVRKGESPLPTADETSKKKRKNGQSRTEKVWFFTMITSDHNHLSHHSENNLKVWLGSGSFILNSIECLWEVSTVLAHLELRYNSKRGCHHRGFTGRGGVSLSIIHVVDSAAG